MTLVRDIETYLQTLAPTYMKMEWDNVGLLCGDAEQKVHKVLIALDPFLHVCQEAAQWGAELIVTHHPLIFHPLRALTQQDATGKCILFLAANKISALNAHTNLDQAPGGVNDCLAAALGLSDVRVIAPQGKTKDGRDWGLLRAGTVAETAPEEFARLVKVRLGCAGVRLVDGGRPVRHVAVGGGACADELEAVIAAGCDTLVTADAKYNQFWDAKEMGVNLIDAGHFETENPVCFYLKDVLQKQFPDVTFRISAQHGDPVQFL